jgi:hypothetical protein
MKLANKSFYQKIIAFFASFYLSCVLFFLLFLLTVLGTLDQVNLGLYATQKKYFESLYLIYDGCGIPILLPGVYLVLIILFINTIVGTICRIKFKPSKYGIYIIHFSMILLFSGSFITFKFSDDGQMTLQEGHSSSRFVSYHEWEIAIIDINDTKTDKEFIFDIDFDKNLFGATITHPELPFSFKILDCERHAIVQPKGPMFSTDKTIVNGYFINPLPIEKENEKNTPAILLQVDVTIHSEASSSYIVSGETSKQNSLQLKLEDKKFVVCLRKKSWEVPFLITLDRVERDLYPGTMQAQAYRSFIRKTESGIEEKKEVYMNHPYRYMDFIFFQSGYTEDPNSNLKYSTFAVVRNPTDHVPLVACILISIGMIVHFLITLVKFLQKESEK